jgi:pimeloyl-ACP methyl ester carboxylesterase
MRKKADEDDYGGGMNSFPRPFETILRFETIRPPTLLVTGDDDRVAGTQNNIRLAHVMPNAHLVVLPACGHVIQEECPQALINGLRQWLDQ